MRIADHTGFMT